MFNLQNNNQPDVRSKNVNAEQSKQNVLVELRKKFRSHLAQDCLKKMKQTKDYFNILNNLSKIFPLSVFPSPTTYII